MRGSLERANPTFTVRQSRLVAARQMLMILDEISKTLEKFVGNISFISL
jgi:hypothetical protein